MAFRAAAAPVTGATAALTSTMPAGTVATDHVLIVLATAGGSGASTITSSRAGFQQVTLVSSNRADNNLSWGAWEVWGVQAGDTVTVTSQNAPQKLQTAYVFTADIGPIGGFGSRGGVSQTTTVVPGRATGTGAKMLVLVCERSTIAATTIASEVTASDGAVTRLGYNTQDGGSDCSIYLGEFTAASNQTGNVTITYSAASGNSGGIQIVEIEGQQTPIVLPVFGGQQVGFTAAVEPIPLLTPTFGGQRATFAAMVVVLGAVPIVTPVFGRAAVFSATIKIPPPRPTESLPPNCELWVDGVRFEDGSLGGGPLEPVALTDLRVTWGRPNTLDQPSPASCTFDVLDVAGGQRYLDVLHIGSRVSVRATATIYPDPTVSTIPNLWPWPLRNGVVTAGFGTPVVKMMTTPNPDGSAMSAPIPPLPFSTDPTAWDGVPRTLPGQSWRLKGKFTLPAAFAGWHGWAATVQPIAFTSPYAPSYGTTLPDVGATAADGSFDLTFVPPSDVWLGFGIRVYPTSPAWTELDATPWNALGAHPTWDELGTFTLDSVQLLAPAAGAARSGAVFAGRITDLSAVYDLDKGGTVVSVIAQDDVAELSNRYVGDEPWGMESLANRFARIVSRSGQAINYTVDADVQGLSISYQDIDSQPAGRLLQDLAQSCGGVLWAATSLVTGPFLRLEDVNARPALMLLQMGNDGLVHIVVADWVADHGITLSACSVLLDPVEWQQDTQDASTRVALTWQEQTTDPGPPVVQKPTERTELQIDAALEAATGRRRVSISTRLSDHAQAAGVAANYLGRLSQSGWRINGLTWRAGYAERLDSEALTDVMTILDGAARLGLPILLTDLPEWSPVSPARANVPLFLEGGRFTNSDGAWELELLTSSAASQGQADVAWQDLPADWSWTEFGPEISWNDLTGVGI